MFEQCGATNVSPIRVVASTGIRASPDVLGECRQRERSVGAASEAQPARLGYDTGLVMFPRVSVLTAAFERAVGAGLHHRDGITAHTRLCHPQDDRAHRLVLGLKLAEADL